MTKNLNNFISSEKLFLFLKYKHFFPDFFSYLGKELDKKTKINVKIYDVTNWKANSFNKHIARYLKK